MAVAPHAYVCMYYVRVFVHGDCALRFMLQFFVRFLRGFLNSPNAPHVNELLQFQCMRVPVRVRVCMCMRVFVCECACSASVGIYANYTPTETCLWAAAAPNLAVIISPFAFFRSFKIQQLPPLPLLLRERERVHVYERDRVRATARTIPTLAVFEWE